jgi:solute carrier family 25 folate transporter 32
MFNNEFTIGTVSSIISYSLTYPIDAIKTNFQIANLKQKPVISDVVKQIYSTHGIRGYYRGISSTLITYPLFWGIFFQTNAQTNVFVASTAASLFTNPLFVLKTRFQSMSHNHQLTNQRLSYFNLTKNIYQNEGIGGFFKGFGSSVANNTKLWIQFPLYDEMNKRTNNVVVSSMVAKIASATIYYPTDLIRTNQRNLKESKSMLEVGKSIYKANGIKGFYSGVLLYNLISIPAFVVMMSCRDYFTKYYSDKDNKSQ